MAFLFAGLSFGLLTAGALVLLIAGGHAALMLAALAGAFAMLTPAFAGTLLLLYLLPSVVAWTRGCRGAGALTVVNVVLGWTFAGWIVCMIWAVAAERRRSVRVVEVARQPAVVPARKPVKVWVLVLAGMIAGVLSGR